MLKVQYRLIRKENALGGEVFVVQIRQGRNWKSIFEATAKSIAKTYLSGKEFDDQTEKGK